MTSRFPFVLIGSRSTDKHALSSSLSPHILKAASPALLQNTPSLFSLSTLDFPSPNFSPHASHSLPKALSAAAAVIYVISDTSSELSTFSTFLQLQLPQPTFLFLLADDVDALQSISESLVQFAFPLENAFVVSLFDGSLVRAMSAIVQRLIPSFSSLQSIIDQLADTCRMDRVILCDSLGFLPIYDTHPDRPENTDPLFTFLVQSLPKSRELDNIAFECNGATAIYVPLLPYAGILTVCSDPSIMTDAIIFNLQQAAPLICDILKSH